MIIINNLTKKWKLNESTVKKIKETKEKTRNRKIRSHSSPNINRSHLKRAKKFKKRTKIKKSP